MSKTTFNTLADEALRLLNLQKDIITALSDEPELLKDSGKDGKQRNFDQEKAERLLKTLDEEEVKVRRLEMTLAVVGTMKAGKSTTINAIVGDEILPNRNTPMTTLPTVIRHTPGRTTPCLIFPKPDPFNEAISKLKESIDEGGEKLIRELPICSSNDGKTLVDNIRNDRLHVRKTYEGREGIFDFLRLINDIARLCDQQTCEGMPFFRIHSPLEAYGKLDEFPVIETEFFHLRNQQGNTGCFSLIDTPGPNEAGKNYLRKILDEQISNASAVLVLMDYTQLNSDADAEVRSALKDVVSRNAERMFVFANKFDQKNANSMGKDELKSYISKELFEEKIADDCIFPVSGYQAYLANRAMRELEMTGKLPDYNHNGNGWVKDFGEEAMGRRWEKKIGDSKEVKECCTGLWEDSLYEKPLEKVIRKASARAAFISLKAAIEKMRRNNDNIADFLQLRDKALNTNIKEIHSHVSSLQQDVNKIEGINKSAETIFSEKQKKLQENLDNLFRDADKEILYIIDKFFEEGILYTKKELENELKEIEKQREENNCDFRIDKIFNSIVNILNPINIKERIDALNKEEKLKQLEKKFIPDGLNRFFSEADAKNFQEQINDNIRTVCQPLLKALEKSVQDTTGTIENDLYKEISLEIGPVLDEAAKRLKETFSVKMDFPKLGSDNMTIDFEEINTANIKEYTETWISKERRWYTLWLWEHETEHGRTVYKVDTKEIGKQLREKIKEQQKITQDNVRLFLEDSISDTVKKYFRDLKAYMGRFRVELEDALHDKKGKEADTLKLQAAMKKFMTDIEDHQYDLEPLNETLKSREDKQEEIPVHPECSLVEKDSLKQESDLQQDYTPEIDTSANITKTAFRNNPQEFLNAAENSLAELKKQKEGIHKQLKRAGQLFIRVKDSSTDDDLFIASLIVDNLPSQEISPADAEQIQRIATQFARTIGDIEPSIKNTVEQFNAILEFIKNMTGKVEVEYNQMNDSQKKIFDLMTRLAGNCKVLLETPIFTDDHCLNANCCGILDRINGIKPVNKNDHCRKFLKAAESSLAELRKKKEAGATYLNQIAELFVRVKNPNINDNIVVVNIITDNLPLKEFSPADAEQIEKIVTRFIGAIVNLLPTIKNTMERFDTILEFIKKMSGKAEIGYSEMNDSQKNVFDMMCRVAGVFKTLLETSIFTDDYRLNSKCLIVLDEADIFIGNDLEELVARM